MGKVFFMGKKRNRTAGVMTPKLDIERECDRMIQSVEDTKADMMSFYPEMLDEGFDEQEMRWRAESLKRSAADLGRAAAEMYTISDEFSTRWSDIKKQRRKRRVLKAAPANAAIDASEQRVGHFASGLNLYKLLLLLFIGSFFGVIIEMIWCYVTRGVIESRAGLVYGPFNLLYGFGAVVLTVCLYGLRNRSAWLSFFGGMIVGSAVEYVCSWAQELVFGSRSWDYSHMPLNLNGRICLLYSIFWGVLGVLWIKNLYPRMAALILKLPNELGKLLTWVLTVFLAINAVITVTAVARWSQRIEGTAESSAFFDVIDDRFDDERMEHIFANMEFSDFGYNGGENE